MVCLLCCFVDQAQTEDITSYSATVDWCLCGSLMHVSKGVGDTGIMTCIGFQSLMSRSISTKETKYMFLC